MKMKNNPRKIHAGKSRIDKNSYQQSLRSNFKLDQTVRDSSILTSDSSAIEDNEKRIKKTKKRPKTFKQKVVKNFGANRLLWISVIIAPVAGWLLVNVYNFNADLRVAENNIINIEKQISEYKQNGIISNNDYISFSKELEQIKNTYAKLNKVNALEKNYEVFKISVEKDIEYLKDKLDNFE